MKQTILIAEDEADIRNILRLYLESENYEVLEAADGESAVAAVRNGSPDLVILDIMMPKLDGFAVVRAIRQQSDIPVLILSARNQDNDKILGLNLGRMTISPSRSTRWRSWHGSRHICAAATVPGRQSTPPAG